MTKREHERLAILETKLEGIDRRTLSIEDKLDDVLEQHNKQRGAIRLAMFLWTLVVGLFGAAAAWFK